MKSEHLFTLSRERIDARLKMRTQWRPRRLGIVHFLEHSAHRNGGQPGLGHDAATRRVSLPFVVVCMIVRLAIERDHSTHMPITNEVPHFMRHGRCQFLIRESSDQTARNVNLTTGPGVSRERFTGDDMQANFSTGRLHRLEQRKAHALDPLQRPIDNQPATLLRPHLGGC